MTSRHSGDIGPALVVTYGLGTVAGLLITLGGLIAWDGRTVVGGLLLAGMSGICWLFVAAVASLNEGER